MRRQRRVSLFLGALHADYAALRRYPRDHLRGLGSLCLVLAGPRQVPPGLLPVAGREP
ncbi:MAG TPA: hypothetical protein VMV92_39750 [Streptosporangiaceae bacterium]|nr:hypothetical protein [Streptosporangiaceae bacterium]